MEPQIARTPARKSRQVLAGVIDGLFCALLFSIGYAIGVLVPTLHHQEAPEQLTGFLLWPMIATGLCFWYARTELGGGTLGQRLARVGRVRVDGSRMQLSDWWKRHWPSLIFIAYGLALIATSIIGSEKIKRDREYIEWMQFWGTVISLAAAALLVAAYILTRSTTKTMLVEKPRIYTGHGFEVVPVERGN